MKTLYFDCFAGASGNMILGALVSLGVSAEQLKRELEKLRIPPFELEIMIKDKSGVSAVHVDVKIPFEHIHRHLRDIEKIIAESELSPQVKTRSIGIFTRLAEAEAKVHGISVEKVHFHEVGALDAIIDVVGACIGFEMLGIENFACSKIHVGSGFVKMAHGKFPVPPPAVAELLTNCPIYSTEIEGELITPTGAAIIAAVCDGFGKMPEMTVEKTAYGAGTRDYKDFPNVLRLMIGTLNEKSPIANGQSPIADLLLLETNLDDLSPQVLGYLMEKSFEIGALDCWFTPIQMKKNRPATLVSILCKKEQRDVFTELLYRETSTLGVRISETERTCLKREIIEIETDFGPVPVKIARFRDKIINVKPEYENLREIALKSNKPLREIEREILKKIDSENFKLSE